MTVCEPYDNCAYALPQRIRAVFSDLPVSLKKDIQEIRLRKGKPLAVTVKGDSYFVRKGDLSERPFSDCITVNDSDIRESFSLLCGRSAFAHETELEDGYIMMKNGCRAGVCGKVSDSGAVTDITSVNIRIARQVPGCADSLINQYTGKGLLIAGAPGSGKTTVLRDLLRQLSNGSLNAPKRVCVIDSRGELSGVNAENPLGFSADVLLAKDKAKGIEIALRTMYPQIIAFDEIGTAKELDGISECFFSGVSVITTAHAGSLDELFNRKITKNLLLSGAISQVALLPEKIGGRITVKSVV